MGRLTHDAHDSLVKTFFSQPVHVVGLLKSALPRKLVKRIDWDTLKLCSSTFIDRRLRPRHGDLLFTVRMQSSRRLIYILLEHQSTPDRSLPWRIYCYLESIWVRHTGGKKNVASLPLVITVVLYHGSRPWRGPNRLSDLFDTEAEGLDVRYPPFLVVDLRRRTDAELRRIGTTAIARLSLFCLKHARSPHFLQRVREHADLFRHVWRDPSQVDAPDAFVRYILMANRHVSQIALGRALARIVGEESYLMIKTTGEKLIERGRRMGRKEGREKGLEEGREEGREEGQIAKHRELLLTLLTKRFGRLPPSTTQQIARASAASLSRWTDRLLEARTLKEALAD